LKANLKLILPQTAAGLSRCGVQFCAANPVGRISQPAATVSPSPGGEGRGEGERKTNFSFPFLSLERPRISPKYCFLPNEPKVVQCLPGKLKKQPLAKAPKTVQKRLKTHLKQPETDSNEANSTPIPPVLRSSSGGGPERGSREPQQHVQSFTFTNAHNHRPDKVFGVGSFSQQFGRFQCVFDSCLFMCIRGKKLFLVKRFSFSFAGDFLSFAAVAKTGMFSSWKPDKIYAINSY
jgi:hypothetical protein